MTDLSISSHFTTGSKSKALAAALAQMGELYTDWHEHTRTAPSLRQVAREVLEPLVPESRAGKNPDTLFINTSAAGGSLASSISMTDALLRALSNGLAEFEQGHAQVYSRHDSVQEQYRVPALTGAFVLEALTLALEVLPDHYKDRLVAFWSEALPAAGREDKSRTRDKICTTLHAEILQQQVELLHLSGQIHDADKRVLAESFTGSNLYRISLRAQAGSGLMNTAFIIPRTPQTRSPLTLDNCEGNVFLVTSAYGLELFESLTDLDLKLRARLNDADEREYLLQDLQLKEQAALGADEGVVINPFYSYLADDLVGYRLDVLRHKQIQDLDFLLSAPQHTRQQPAELLSASESVGQLSYLDVAQKRYFQQSLNDLRKNALPRWLLDASTGDQEFYRSLAANYQKHEDQAAELMAGLESIRTYASNKINAHVLNALGYRIDPERVFISMQDKFALSAQITEQFTYRKSLLDCAVEGLPAAEKDMVFTLEVPAQYQHPALDFAFVEKMIAQLDVQQHFELDTERRFYEEQTVRAIAHQRDSAIALSAWAAQLQGHLREDKSQELIQWVRGDRQQAGTDVSMGRLAILGSGHVMKDVLVFRMDRNDMTHFVLYAPGAPGGRDLFEFSNWQRLSIEVGGWVAKPEGAKYVIEQVAIKYRAAVTSLIRSTLLKPTEWQASTLVFVPMAPLSYESNLIIQVREKVAQDLSETFVENANHDLSETYLRRRELALLDARISSLNELFREDVELQPYREFAREKGREWIAQYFNARGMQLTVDPDTVWFNLNSQRDERNPFNGPPVEDVSLTTLLMNDFQHKEAFNTPVLDEYLNTTLSRTVPVWALGKAAYDSLKQWFLSTPEPVMYSTAGQDLTALPMKAIRELLALPLGEDYIGILKGRLYDSDEDAIFYRRAVLAKRKYFEIHRDALSECLRGRLTQQQYEWLIPLLGSVDSSITSAPASEPGSVNMLVFDNSSSVLLGDDGRIIEGALLFTRLDHNDPGFRLIYTPDAPDGIRFRTHEQLVETMKSPGMPAYYHARASYKDQPVVGTLVENLEQYPDQHRATFSTLIRPVHRVVNLEQLYEVMIQRMIEDVDKQTESATERDVEMAYKVVKWTGSILAMPFPPAALAWGLIHSSVEFARGYSAYRDGDRATALKFFMWGYFGLILAASTSADIATRSTGKVWRLIRWATTDRLKFPVL